MATVITIPEELLKKGELVLLSRKEYETLLHIREAKQKSPLDRNLEKALKEVRNGKAIGPFTSASVLRNSLGR